MQKQRGRFDKKKASSQERKQMIQIIDDKSDPFPQLGSVYRKGSGVGQLVNQLSENVANITVKSAQSSAPIASPWGRPNLIHNVEMQSNIDKAKAAQVTGFKSFSSNIGGLNLSASEVGSSQSIKGKEQKEEDQCVSGPNVDENEYDEVFGSTDDEDSDSETGEKSHESLKKGKWFKAFFSDMDRLSVDEINSPERKWHCPACKGGPGGIDWYRGLEPLMYHARTRKTRRAKLHRVFSEILEEEARRRGIFLTPSGVSSDRWQGLSERAKDFEIVWPPMVVIMNTRCEQDDNGKWIGMGNQELLDCFQSFAALKARHAYGPQGHRGISVLIFDASAAGYLEADRLDKHFKEQGRGRDAWNSSRKPFCSGGRRRLCGFMALNEDLNIFNQHSQGRSKLKFEMRSYQEMVGRQIRQINENNQQHAKCKDKIAKVENHSQVLAESMIRMGQQLYRAVENNRDMRQQTKLLVQDHKEELDSQEQFFNDQLKVIQQAKEEKEANFDKLPQPSWAKVELPNAPKLDSQSHRIKDQKMKEFEAEKKKLISNHEEKKASTLKELEKELENQLYQLIQKYKDDLPVAETENLREGVSALRGLETQRVQW